MQSLEGWLMKRLVLAVMSLGLSIAAFGQRRGVPYWSLGGYGNVLFPGTGHAPSTPPGGVNGPHFNYWAAPSSKPAHPRQPPFQQPPLVPVPVQSLPFDGGYSEEHLGNNPAEEPGTTLPTTSAPMPPVIINQNLVPPTGNSRTGDSNPNNGAQACVKLQGEPNSRQIGEDRPTIYLIAFKDHRVVQALGYWMEAGTLHYVSAEYAVNQASMVLIDRDLSQRLNDERGVAFRLPAQK
jgi:hypothetical protein